MRILIAEDDVISARLLAEALAKLDHDAEICPDGHAAIERFQAEPTRLIISDWWMPELDGLQLCRRIRSLSDQYVYFILLTAAKSTDGTFAEAVEAGIDDFLSKPFDLDNLRMRLRVADRVLRTATAAQIEAEYASPPLVLDAETLIDGRIAFLLRANLITRPVMIPGSSLDFLKELRNSAEKPSQARALIGLATIKQFQEQPGLTLRVATNHGAVNASEPELAIEAAHLARGIVLTTNPKVRFLADEKGITAIDLGDICNSLMAHQTGRSLVTA